MDNRKLGVILIVLAILLAIILISFKIQAEKSLEMQIEQYGGACPMEGFCPHQQLSRLLIPIYIAASILFLIVGLGIYLIFFEKGQKEILKTLKETKEKSSADERFDLLLSALDEYEKKVMKAVREQNGITQATLRIRTDMSKAKLSLVISALSKKNLIKKVPKGKTNQIYLKKAI